MTLDEIARLVGGRLTGSGSVVVTGVSGIEEARPGDVTFIANKRYLPYLDTTKAAVVLVEEGLKSSVAATIEVRNPNLAFAQLAAHLASVRNRRPAGVHPSASVAPGAKVGADVAIGACAVVEDGAVVGDGAMLHPLSYVGRGARLGPGCVLHPHSAVMDGCVLGARVILQPGAIVGSDGFGYATVEGVHHKIPQLGNVIVGDDVEIGSHTCVDRARFDKTVIKAGTKIDNLVQIGHNVEVGEHCLLVAQAGIAGSTVIGRNVVIGGQAGIAGHLVLADRTIVTAQSGLGKDTKAGVMYSGEHAIEHRAHFKQLAALRRLPDLLDEVKRLRKEVDELRGRTQIP